MKSGRATLPAICEEESGETGCSGVSGAAPPVLSAALEPAKQGDDGFDCGAQHGCKNE
jgi:hypothetical protein